MKKQTPKCTILPNKFWFRSIVHSKKTEPWQPQLVGWYERRPLHDPNKVFAYWSKKKTTTFGAKTIVLFKKLGTGCCSQPLPSEHRCVWPLKVLPFLLLSIFRLHGCHFSGWGSRVGGLLISETSIFTIDNGDEARKGRTTEPWRSPPNRQRRSAFKKARLLRQKKSSGILFCTSTYRGFCCCPLCIAPVQLQCKVISATSGLCAPHVGMAYVRRTPAANACLWVKRQNHWFSREKRKVAFPR